MYKALSNHVIQRYKDRGLKLHRLHKDLSMKNLRKMITANDGSKLVYTKNNLKFVIKDEVVLTVMKIRPYDIKRDLKKHGYM